MKLDSSLNFVVPLFHGEDDGSPYAYVYARPISVAAFEANYRLLVRTFQTMMEEGSSAMRFARLFMKDAAAALPNGEAMATALLNEVGRLSSAVVATARGWETIPLQQAVDAKLLDDGDGDEAIGAAVFFLAVWHISPKSIRSGLLASGTQAWSAELSPLPPMEWIASLPTLTEAATSGETAPRLMGTITVIGHAGQV